MESCLFSASKIINYFDSTLLILSNLLDVSLSDKQTNGRMDGHDA